MSNKNKVKKKEEKSVNMLKLSMKINKWWGSLIGLIISIIVGIPMGGYAEGDNLIAKNLVGWAIIVAGFLIGWYLEEPKN